MYFLGDIKVKNLYKFKMKGKSIVVGRYLQNLFSLSFFEGCLGFWIGDKVQGRLFCIIRRGQ